MEKLIKDLMFNNKIRRLPIIVLNFGKQNIETYMECVYHASGLKRHTSSIQVKVLARTRLNMFHYVIEGKK